MTKRYHDKAEKIFEELLSFVFPSSFQWSIAKNTKLHSDALLISTSLQPHHYFSQHPDLKKIMLRKKGRLSISFLLKSTAAEMQSKLDTQAEGGLVLKWSGLKRILWWRGSNASSKQKTRNPLCPYHIRKKPHYNFSFFSHLLYRYEKLSKNKFVCTKNSNIVCLNHGPLCDDVYIDPTTELWV